MMGINPPLSSRECMHMVLPSCLTKPLAQRANPVFFLLHLWVPLMQHLLQIPRSAELASQGIRVNLICQGIIDTPMHHRSRKLIGDDIYDKTILPSVHLKRSGRPDEVARAIIFLCSDEASYITGTTLTPDGGFTLTI